MTLLRHVLTDYSREMRGLEAKGPYRNPLLDKPEEKKKLTREEQLAKFRAAEAKRGGAKGRVETSRARARAVELARLQWRKRVNEARIRTALKAKVLGRRGSNRDRFGRRCSSSERLPDARRGNVLPSSMRAGMDDPRLDARRGDGTDAGGGRRA